MSFLCRKFDFRMNIRTWSKTLSEVKEWCRDGRPNLLRKSVLVVG